MTTRYLDLNDPNVRQHLALLDAHATESMRAAFIQNHPELLRCSPENDAHNETAIYAVVAQNGWAPTPANLEAAYAVVKEAGQLRLEPEVVGQSNTPISEQEFFNTASTRQLRDYFEKKYQAPAKPNALEHFMDFGGRAQDTILNRGEK
jgi:hypothetical protein